MGTVKELPIKTFQEHLLRAVKELLIKIHQDQLQNFISGFNKKILRFQQKQVMSIFQWTNASSQ
jgi:hypothetical protein